MSFFISSSDRVLRRDSSLSLLIFIVGFISKYPFSMQKLKKCESVFNSILAVLNDISCSFLAEFLGEERISLFLLSWYSFISVWVMPLRALSWNTGRKCFDAFILTSMVCFKFVVLSRYFLNTFPKINLFLLFTGISNRFLIISDLIVCSISLARVLSVAFVENRNLCPCIWN